MTVERILRTKGNDVVTIGLDASLSSAVHTLTKHRIGALVVSRDGRQVDGILSERDVVSLIGERGASALDAQVSEIMSRNVVTCARHDRIESLMSVMTAKRIRHLPVVEDGALCGMISIGDVVKSRIEEVEFEAQSLREYIAGH